MKKVVILLMAITSSILAVQAQEKVNFKANDSLLVVADWYGIRNIKAPVIILCHQAGFSRGEYVETAPILNRLGYNCIAVDLRSGESVKDVSNETALHAKDTHKAKKFINAKQDIEAAINYVKAKVPESKIVLLGSSYSASLALIIAAENVDVSAVVAFSPGEYLGKKISVSDAIESLTKPAFVTSSMSEAADVSELLYTLPNKTKIQFIPKREGVHGSKALWEDNPNNSEYWLALTQFLQNLH
jgi:dienelactone hydrolase